MFYVLLVLNFWKTANKPLLSSFYIYRNLIIRFVHGYWGLAESIPYKHTFSRSTKHNRIWKTYLSCIYKADTGCFAVITIFLNSVMNKNYHNRYYWNFKHLCSYNIIYEMNDFCRSTLKMKKQKTKNKKNQALSKWMLHIFKKNDPFSQEV